MKTIKQPENADELLDILIHEDVTFTISMSNMDYEFLSGSGFSADSLSQANIRDMVEKVFHDLGAVVHIRL